MKRLSTLVVGALGLLVSLQGPAPVVAASNKAAQFTLRAAPSVDLGYAIYEGSYNSTSKLNSFKAIRYAAPPLGNLRFAAPAPPATNRSSSTPATTDPPKCPQTGVSAETPASYGFVSALGDEDCLFLNVFAPANATNVPVFFWIHGGGYSVFSAHGLDPTEFMATNENNFVSVVIQYRLGAFGFLSSADVYEDGALNAGLLDMNFALQWVQKYITKFGGDPTRVTIAGESSGAASVMYQAMAYGGKQNETLFTNIIAASPWIPHQYAYNDTVPTQHYDDFATAAGCAQATNTLQCLRDSETTALQNASGKVSEAGPFGTFAFTPVTDGTFIQQRPTEQLQAKALKGKRILSGNLANEGIPLSPPTYNTLALFRKYINTTFPTFSPAEKTALESQYAYPGSSTDYPQTNNNTNTNTTTPPLFSTTGTHPPTALSQSPFATGQQQRLFNLFAEYAIDCPSYWLASAFPPNTSWKYEYDIPPAYHGSDLTAHWSLHSSVPGTAFKHAYQKIWGTFITANTPVISIEDAKGGMQNASIPGIDALEWPTWNEQMPRLLSLNTTGGTPVLVRAAEHLQYEIYLEPGVTNVFKVASAESWEGGRGQRCRWWRGMADKVPY